MARRSPSEGRGGLGYPRGLRATMVALLIASVVTACGGPDPPGGGQPIPEPTAPVTTTAEEPGDLGY